MSQPLPTYNFKWLSDKEMEESDVIMVPDDSSREYILECDLGIISTISIFMYISETVMFLSNVFQSTLVIS